MPSKSEINTTDNQKPTVMLFVAVVLALSAGFIITNQSSTMFVVAGIIGIIIVARTFVKPEFGLLVLIFITYLRISDIGIYYHGIPSIAKPFIALLGLVIVLRWLRIGIQEKGMTKAIVLVGAYGLVVFTSLFYATDFSEALTAFSDLWKDWLITIMIVILLQKYSTLEGVVWTLIIAGAFIGTISVFQYITGSFSNNYWGFAQSSIQNIVGTTDDYRIAGQIGDPNFYAQILLIIVPLALNRYRTEQKWLKKLFALYTLGVVLLSIVFTFSRGAVVGLFAIFLALMIYHPPKMKEIIIAGLLGLMMLPFIPATYYERLGTIADLAPNNTSVKEEVSFRGRASELIVALQLFRDHPVFGVGVSNYPILYQEYSKHLGLDTRTEQRQPHNLYLEVAAETGLLGIISFSAILIYMFRSIRTAWRAFSRNLMKNQAGLVYAIGVSILGYLTAALFIHGAYPRYFWILVGIALSLPSVSENLIIQMNNKKTYE